MPTHVAKAGLRFGKLMSLGGARPETLGLKKVVMPTWTHSSSLKVRVSQNNDAADDRNDSFTATDHNLPHKQLIGCSLLTLPP